MDRAVEVMRTLALYNRVSARPDQKVILLPELVPQAAAEVLARIGQAPQSLIELASISEPVLRHEVAPLLEEVAQTLWPDLPERDPELSDFLTGYWLQCMEQRCGEPDRLFDLIYFHGSVSRLDGEDSGTHVTSRLKTRQRASRAAVNAWRRLHALRWDAPDRGFELDPFQMSKAAKRVLDALEKTDGPILRRGDGPVVFVPAWP